MVQIADNQDVVMQQVNKALGDTYPPVMTVRTPGAEDAPIFKGIK